MSPESPPVDPKRASIISLSFSATLLAGRHRRCHGCAEYLAQIAASAGADSAMAAREISASVFELLELVRSQHRPGAIEVRLFALPDGIEVEATLPGDDTLAGQYARWLADDPGRDPLLEPCPGDGLRELADLHGVKVALFDAGDRIGLSLRIGLEMAPSLPEAAHGG